MQIDSQAKKLDVMAYDESCVVVLHDTSKAIAQIIKNLQSTLYFLWSDMRGVETWKSGYGPEDRIPSCFLSTLSEGRSPR